MSTLFAVPLGVLTAALALADWYAVATSRNGLERLVKAPTTVALAATAAVAGAVDEPAGRWLIVALLLGAVGDAALLGSTRERFLAGLSAFFAGHLAYLACFLTLGLDVPGWSWLWVPLLGVLLVGTRDVVPNAWRHGGPALAVPVAAYSAVIGAVLALAWLTGEPWTAAGAAIFALSDSIIGATTFTRSGPRFGDGSPRVHLAVMVTYYAGQALIAYGVLR
ncbi:MAG: lysoplasmalogenase [Nocardioides sp.]|uniref:lysoplasmalogenase family protein n=1 Tax=Nocardioides sp. TaxID=35761 RepID=UPI0039E6A4FE